MIKRGRRLRANSAIRDLVRENTLTANDLIFPIFVVEGENIKEEISSLQGNYHWSIDRLDEVIKEVEDLGIKGVIVFGLPEHKDECGSEAYSDEGIVQKAVRKIREISKKLYVITDVCMCQYTSHGHCGILDGENVDNDSTLEKLGRIALSHAKAGAHMVAPSDMMDGRVAYIRDILDKYEYENVAIMSYAAKYCSAFYGPFREAAHSAPNFGDRKTYQMDPANGREALREIEMDIEEGADIIMVKPAMPYLDIVRATKDRIDLPICVYNVSGEFAMVKAAANAGLINEKAVVLEMLVSMKRAGADMIITYYAIEAAKWLKE
ncbi:porphobilinogen synthase [Clostridium chauvoei]|uniref:Delta-aminolevulinic acid dehydratase n=2 Tax=Clostridium chauvoei TaxID=46867 RepID=S6F803_9CLOT|nr:porphobilinogen synthase [Clostridium chauvoei]ATD54531.1 delta-aminolevulinic acid dehydratase [Clostridium chauvoei]ATD57787.1 delta-aminolevulinic acid dehydratase [Clostridium chauvoei]MBX7281082.1 porphobilinogen synthase [Clostridium chauvoei]MBX7283531.1 porphobilinogen synthase [Clostridium chauvoei]MBX7286055.1 porphobilinogen synthase [Clostridium chauvoei]